MTLMKIFLSTESFLRNYFNGGGGGLNHGNHKGLPIAKSQFEIVASAYKFKYQKRWTCQCGAQLQIRSSFRRNDGPSNFNPTRSGHATLPAGKLNWDGLAEERGWKPDLPGMCPACQAGVDVPTYKRLRRLAEQESHERLLLARIKEKYNQ